VRDDGQIALHASAARESSPDSVGRPLVARTLAPLVHSRPHNKSGLAVAADQNWSPAPNT